MNTLTKNLIAGAVVGSLAMVGVVTAQEEVRHKTIEIKAAKDSDVSVWIDSDGFTQTVIMTATELADSEILEEKLADLDDETKATVMRALQGMSLSGDGEDSFGLEKIFVVNKGDGHRVEFIGDYDANMDIEMTAGSAHRMVRKHVIHVDGEHGILKGHSNAIAKLIEKGEFSQEELDKIQAALDAKR